MDCVFCWHYNFSYPKQHVKLKNSKYCKLYPDDESTRKHPILNLDDCKSLYTKCDYSLENFVHEYILSLEKLLKDHEKLVKQEVEMQKELINDMWIQSQRYLILTRSGLCVKPYPEIVSLPTEKIALCSFHTSLRQINKSNCLLTLSLENIRTSFDELNRRCEQLDMSVESPFTNGSYSIKSLSYIRNILNDLFNYFYSNLCKLKCWAQLLDPGDSGSAEDYMYLIKSKKEHDLMENFNDCTCLRTKQKKCIKIHMTS